MENQETQETQPNISQTAEQAVQPVEPVEQPQGTQQPGSDDVLKRVSEFMTEKVPTEENQNDIDNKFNVNDIDNIQDPQAKEYAQKAYKSLQGQYTKQFQELASDRKEFEKTREVNTSWTPERVQSLLNDQEFVSAAQQVTGQPAEYNDSILSESEQAKITTLENKVKQMEQNSLATNRAQETERLKNVYPHYNSQAMDTITKEILDQKRMIGLEDVWKSYNYKQAVEAAYEMGLKESKAGNIEKIQSMSMTGNTVVSGDTPVERKDNENNRSYARKSFAASASKVLGSLVHGRK